MSNRTTVYNNITSKEKISLINKSNLSLIDEFCIYLESVGRADTTIKNYKADLLIFFCWVLENADNKDFSKLSKREIIKFQNHAIKIWGWSSNRIRTVKSAVASLGNYIENILDETDEYNGFRSVVRKVESPPLTLVREKTVLSEEEVKELLNYLVDNKQFDKACLVALAMYSGRRKSELCRFKISDFSTDNLVCGGALYKSSPIKTKGRGGGKYINCYTLAKKIQPYLDLWILYRKSAGIESEWLFPLKTDPSKQMLPSTIDNWGKEFSKFLGKQWYPHCMRHLFTTLLSQAGIPDNVIQTIVSWESSDMVRLYNDTPQEEQMSEYFKDGDIFIPSKKDINDM